MESHGIETPNSWFLLASSPLVLAMSLDPGAGGHGSEMGGTVDATKLGHAHTSGCLGLGEILPSIQICTLSDILVTYMLKVYREINAYG